MSRPPRSVPLEFRELPADEMVLRAREFRAEAQRRRTVREFSSRPIPPNVLRDALVAAGTAPSGANQQPWHFVVVTDRRLKREIRFAAEAEEREFYDRRAPEEWLKAVRPFGTDASKPFLEIAPALVAVFVQPYRLLPDGTRIKHYYPVESVGLATGILITALHRSGLATLTHTPSPMRFLNELLGRPGHERAFVLLVVGYPATGARVPDIRRKELDEYVTWM